MAMYPEYLGHFSTFSDSCSSREMFVEFLKSKGESLHLTETRRYVSIGSSDGKYDCQLINSVLPGLRWYEAVDIDPESLQQLQQKHRSTKSNYQVLTHCARAEDWTGPKDLADVISLLHVLYYMEDVHAFLDQCLSWTKPGGYIIISLGHENSFTDAFFRELTPETVPTKVRQWRNADVKEIEEYKIRGLFDLTQAAHSTTSLLLVKNATSEEVTNLSEKMEKLYEDITMLPEDEAVWIVKKRLA